MRQGLVLLKILRALYDRHAPSRIQVCSCKHVWLCCRAHSKHTAIPVTGHGSCSQIADKSLQPSMKDNKLQWGLTVGGGGEGEGCTPGGGGEACRSGMQCCWGGSALHGYAERRGLMLAFIMYYNTVLISLTWRQ